MEKVILTEEQAEAIEKLYNFTKPGDVKFHATRKWTEDTLLPLNELSLDNFIKALYIGYEIEPEKPKFQPGDKVVKISGERFKSQILVDTVRADSEYAVCNLTLETGWHLRSSEVRHATPEEIYWLETLGRERVEDFRKGDVIFTRYNSVFIVNDSRADEDDFISKEKASYLHLTGIYPAESYKPYPQEETK